MPRHLKNFKRVDDVAAWRLCLGCGACVWACKQGAITLEDVVDRGLRPRVDDSKCRRCGECVVVCPGIEISRNNPEAGAMPQLCLSWGQVLEIWEGYACDKDIRYMGSSGGAATALALYCLEKRGISGVLHTGVDSACALRNAAVFSVKRDDLIASTGSRYSPAGPCVKLSSMENYPGPSVFIGKPCDVVALRKSQAVSSGLMKKADLAISIFCAGTPATLGTLKMLEELGVDEEDVREIRYRGCGWHRCGQRHRAAESRRQAASRARVPRGAGPRSGRA